MIGFSDTWSFTRAHHLRRSGCRWFTGFSGWADHPTASWHPNATFPLWNSWPYDGEQPLNKAGETSSIFLAEIPALVGWARGVGFLPLQLPWSRCKIPMPNPFKGPASPLGLLQSSRALYGQRRLLVSFWGHGLRVSPNFTTKKWIDLDMFRNLFRDFSDVSFGFIFAPRKKEKGNVSIWVQ